MALLTYAFRHSNESLSIHELVVDDTGEPIDYVFVDVNNTFEQYTGLTRAEVIGKRATKAQPAIEKSGLTELYGDVVLTGEPVRFEQFSEPLQRYYRISAYPMGGSRFATAFEDITEVKQAQGDLQERSEFIEGLIRAIPDAVVYVFDTATRQSVAYWYQTLPRRPFPPLPDRNALEIV